MVVVFIVTIAAAMTVPMLQEQLYQRELDTISTRFIQHAHLQLPGYDPRQYTDLP